MQENKKGTPDEKIVSKAKVWRRRDQEAVADKGNQERQRAEYRARQQLRQAVDQAGQP